MTTFSCYIWIPSLHIPLLLQFFEHRASILYAIVGCSVWREELYEIYSLHWAKAVSTWSFVRFSFPVICVCRKKIHMNLINVIVQSYLHWVGIRHCLTINTHIKYQTLVYGVRNRKQNDVYTWIKWDLTNCLYLISSW